MYPHDSPWHPKTAWPRPLGRPPSVPHTQPHRRGPRGLTETADPSRAFLAFQVHSTFRFRSMGTNRDPVFLRIYTTEGATHLWLPGPCLGTHQRATLWGSAGGGMVFQLLMCWGNRPCMHASNTLQNVSPMPYGNPFPTGRGRHCLGEGGKEGTFQGRGRCFPGEGKGLFRVIRLLSVSNKYSKIRRIKMGEPAAGVEIKTMDHTWLSLSFSRV